MPTILLSATEPSADAMGASLLRRLRERLPDVRFVGCGGGAMTEAGLKTAFDPSGLAVMGLADAARAVPEALRGARALATLAAAERVDAAVLIDAWGFSRLAAPRIARAAPGAALVKLAAPQVWATRPGRARFVRDRFDLVLTLLPFEPPLFDGGRARAVHIGNPNFRAVADAPRDGAAFRARHALGDAPVLLVLPGSRAAEVDRLMPVFAEASRRVATQVEGLRLVIAAAPPVADAVMQAAAGWQVPPLIVPGAERFDAMAAADAALAASGTVTTELAICGVPMTVAYRTDALTAAWVRRIVVTPFASIVNVAAGEAVVPERLQEDCTPARLASDALCLLTDEAARTRQRSAFARIVPDLLGQGDDPATRAAAEIATLIGNGPRP